MTGALLLFVAGVAMVVLGLVLPQTERAARPAEGPVRRALDAAGLHWPPAVLGALCASSGLVAAAFAEALTGLAVVALIAAVAGFPIPIWIVLQRGASRRRTIIDAWPDAIDALLAGVRSGDSLPSALGTAAAGGPVPLRPALSAAADRARATGDFGAAVRAMAVDLADPVSSQVAAVLGLAHEVGGRDVGQVLRDLAGFVRDERALRRELEARQAWTISAARVAAAGPWAVLVVLTLRGEMRDAFAGSGGTAVLLIGTVLSVAGYRLMLMIGRLPQVADA